jgi:hypothetical protein
MPVSGSSGATGQSEPKQTCAPERTMEPTAKLVRSRSGPTRRTAQRPSSIAW